MDIRQLYLITAMVCTIAYSNHTHAREFSVVSSSPPESLTRYGEFVMAGLLEDVGLSFPDDKKSDDTPNPQPHPEPQPRPTPDPKPDPVKRGGDDFFDNDDFFDDDKGFDKIVKDFDDDFEKTLAAWDEEYERTVARWNKAKKVYQKEKDSLAGATFDLTAHVGSSSVSKAYSSRSVIAAMSPGDYHVLPYAFKQEIRDQKARTTCAAFAGVRAIETVLVQTLATSKVKLDLSEQHFFWLSRKDCQQAPCSASGTGNGSWAGNGFAATTNTRDPRTALREELACPYKPVPDNGNLTYTPLSNCMQKNGSVRVGRYSDMFPFSKVVEELSQNRPVVAGFKLTPSYYDTKGIVRARSQTKTKMDSHAGGHAMLLIGYMKLPEQEWATEGQYCAIMANSWGQGYGVGGYACLTETWMKENRFTDNRGRPINAFSSVSSVKIQ